MEDIREKRRKMISEIEKTLSGFSEADLKEKRTEVVNRLFDFANYLEARIALLYIPGHPLEIDTKEIIRRSHEHKKIVVLPLFHKDKKNVGFYKVDDPETELIVGEDGKPAPDAKKCREIPIDNIDIALIPGIAFDEKGGRIGSDEGEFDKMMAKLPITTRKVSVVMEEQIAGQIPMESKAKYVDIVITDKRVIYKI